MSQVFCAHLDDLAILELQGGQPDKLLQGQITADMNLVTPEQALPGLLCSLKGRVISSFEVVAFAEDHLALILPADNLEAVQSHLKKYEPFFKTRLLETTDQYQLLGLSGKETPALIASLLGAWPKSNYRQAVTDKGLVLHLPGPLARGLVLLHRDHEGFAATLDKIKSLTAAVPLDCWRMLDIQVGRAQVNADLADQYLPQMLNYQALGAVSFKKGCYIGQEVVARAQFRGQVKKRLHRVHLNTDKLQLPAAVYDSAGKQQGEIIQTASDRRGELEALAVINQKALEENDQFFANSELTLKASLLNLPYDQQARVALHGAEA
ncbi:folate-binding protein [Marinospirillum sp.]|uniref:CAF17-like 4Fe-4S cluster assembly/insertion protein YgfZ n=1 Tax=Marinospirillum sp. TaxID=2183934 RepID=UPI002870A883|nr:folate-binding protein [Marinospirillum sp.]MDR9468726.1 folate-binding protein [Marinospirillum sp.]